MSGAILYVEDRKVDLYPNTIIATTFQLCNIGDLRSRNVSHTNQIKVPRTPANDITFGYAGNEHSLSRKPYTRLPGKVVSNGMDILPNARVIIKQADNSYNLQIYDNTKEFFDALENRFVDELDLELFGDLTDDFIDTYKNNIGDICCPVIDYGRMVPVSELLNDSFRNNATAFDAEPWTQEGSGVDFTGDSQHVARNGVVADFNIWSKYLTNDFKFYNGIEYVVSVEIEIMAALLGVEMEVYASDGTSRTLIGAFGPFNAADTEICTDTFTAGQDWPKVEIRLLHGSNVNDGIVLMKKITIRPIIEIDIKAPYYLPCIGYDMIIQKIIEATGYDYSLTGININLRAALAIAFGRDEFTYSQRYVDRFAFDGLCIGDQVIARSDGASEKILFNDILVHGGENCYSETTGIYSIPLAYYLTVSFRVSLQINITSIGAGNTVRVFYSFNSFGEVVDYTTGGVKTIEFNIDPRDVGGSIAVMSVSISRTAGANPYSVTIESGRLTASISNIPISIYNISGLILPDIEQKEFMRDFIYRFGLLVREKYGTLEFRTIEDIILDQNNAVDWTLKRVKTVDSIDFTNSNYAQSNLFTDDGGDDNITGSKASLTVDNENLETEKTIHDSFMAPVVQEVVDGLQICRIPVYDFETTPFEVSEDFDAKVRLVHLRDWRSTDPTIKYNGVSTLDYQIAVYNSPVETRRASWDYLLEQFYPSLQTALNKTKIITRFYNLTDIDIASLDLFKLIHDQGSYYLLNKVAEYVPGRLTKVELFKVD